MKHPANAGRRGAAGQQYAIIVGLIGVVAIFAIAAAGGSVKTLMTRTGNTLALAANGLGPATEAPAPPASGLAWSTAQANLAIISPALVRRKPGTDGWVNCAAYATPSRSSGKWYFEVVFRNTTTGMLGYSHIGLSRNTTDCWVGNSSAHSLGFYTHGVTLQGICARSLGGGHLFGQASANIGVAVDIDAGKVWFRRNGAWIDGDPAVNGAASCTSATLQGLLHVGTSQNDAGNETEIMANPSHSIPDGFSPW